MNYGTILLIILTGIIWSFAIYYNKKFYETNNKDPMNVSNKLLIGSAFLTAISIALLAVIISLILYSLDCTIIIEWWNTEI